jgi:hypothetical protein
MDHAFSGEAKTVAPETLSRVVSLLKRKGCKLMTKTALKFIGKDFLVHQKERRLYEPLTVTELKRRWILDVSKLLGW